jgi:hypothetical protein
MNPPKACFIVITILLSMAGLSACNEAEDVSTGNPYAGGQVATFSRPAELATSAMSVPAVRTSTPISGYSVLLQDDFSDPTSGWEISANDYGKTEYQQGVYLVEAYIQKEYYWGVTGRNFDDTRIDIDVRVLQTASNGNDAFGVDCRVQENGDGYGFRISSDGYAGLVKFVDTKGSSLVDWFKSDAILLDGGVNHLTSICQGNHFEFLINGQQVLEAADDTFGSGDIALSAISYETEPISVEFDNLMVQLPQSE